MHRSSARRVLAAAGLFLITGLAAGLGPASPAQAAATDSMVSVVHGIPGQPVDVYVNGKKRWTTSPRPPSPVR